MKGLSIISRNIVLIGLPGCGKTTLGRDVAKLLNMSFFDLDEFIETEQCAKISEIFEAVGEKGFRKIETEACKVAITKQNTIISTGGGVVTIPENIEILSKNSVFIFIDRLPDKILSKIETSHRPLLKDEPNKIFRLDMERRHLYEETAAYHIRNTGSFNKTLATLLKTCEGIRAKRDFFVIGSPIKHSLSPAIHTPVLVKYLLNCSYEIKEVSPSELPDFVQWARETSVSGFSITMPHKKNIISLLDEVSNDARMLNSVNTVVNKNGILKGYSTDGDGFFYSLSEKSIKVVGSNILILGAGGASSAVAMKMAEKGVKTITILARRVEKALELANSIKKEFPNVNTYADKMSDDVIAKKAKDIDILINATSKGMEGVSSEFDNLDFLDNFKKNSVVYDLIYKPEETLLLKSARNKGLTTMNGLGMLIYQALIADEIYLDSTINFKKMKLEIERNLKL